MDFTLYQRQNFRYVQIERVSRGQNNCDIKLDICFGLYRKHYGKSRKCCLQHFFLFARFFFQKAFSGPFKLHCVLYQLITCVNGHGKEALNLKTFLEKEKMLANSKFSLSNNVFQPNRDSCTHLGYQ